MFSALCCIESGVGARCASLFFLGFFGCDSVFYVFVSLGLFLPVGVCVVFEVVCLWSVAWSLFVGVVGFAV